MLNLALPIFNSYERYKRESQVKMADRLNALYPLGEFMNRKLSNTSFDKEMGRVRKEYLFRAFSIMKSVFL